MKILLVFMIFFIPINNLKAASECVNCWGAVGTGPNGTYAWAVGFYSEDAALNEMNIECNFECENWLTFYETCGSIAEDVSEDDYSKRSWGWGKHPINADAETLAVEGCLNDGGNECEAMVWACSM